MAYRAKTVVCRVSTEIKTKLERVARRRNMSLSAVLETAVREWLVTNPSHGDEYEEQRSLHLAALECHGIFAGTDGGRSETAGAKVRGRLRRKYGR